LIKLENNDFYCFAKLSNYSLVILCDSDVNFRILMALRAVRGSHT